MNTKIQKRLLLVVTLVVLSGLSPTLPTQASDQYFALTTGAWSPHATTLNYYDRYGVYSADTNYDTGWSLAGAYGIQVNKSLKVEWELGYKQADAKGSNDSSWIVDSMLNVWWQAPTQHVAPYFGGGVGFARTHVASYDMYDATGSGIAFQAGGGLDIPINHHGLSLDLGYRYFVITSTSSDYNGSPDLNQSGSQFSLGIRSKF